MYRIGIDLGGTNIATGVVDEEYHILGRASLKTPTDSAEKIIDAMLESIALAILDAGISTDEVSFIGVGIPGDVDSEKGILENACNFEVYDVPIATLLSEKTGKRVYVGNDANVAAYCEYIAGAGRGTDSFVMVTLGTGIGSGIIINGEILTGCNCVGGELGHMCIDMDGKLCNCGSEGCWEMYASATALISQAKEAMLEDLSSKLWSMCDGQLDHVTGKTVFEAMGMGDETAKKVVDTYCKYLSVGILNIVRIFQPDMICIGGGISNQGDVLIRPIQQTLDECYYASRRLKKHTEIRIAELRNDAGIIGAACLDFSK